MGNVNKSRLKINRTKISEELRDHAALFAFAAEESEILHDQVSKLELKLELTEDKLANETRHKYRNVNVKLRPNETAIRAQINTNEDIQKLKKELVEIRHAHRLSKVRVDALKIKGEMLVSMAHNIRQERKSSGGQPKV